MKHLQLISCFRRWTTLSSLGFCLGAGLPSASKAALTVNAAPVSEGNPGGAVRSAVFTLTLSPGAAADTVYEYTTASDTARELEDYLPVRGSVTIPAGQSTATVSVPLVADGWAENPESFSLIVWPGGTAGPVPELTPIVIPPGDPSGWTGSLTGLSEGNWFIGNLLGERSGSGWTGLRYSDPSLPAPPGTGQYFTISGRWLGVTGWTAISPEHPGGLTFSGFTEKTAATPAWDTLTEFPGLPPGGSSREIAMSGDIAAVRMHGGVHTVGFYQLQPGAPATFLGSLVLATIPHDDGGAENVIAMALAGRRLAVASEAVVRIYEAAGQDLKLWQQVAYLNGLTLPLALEGDTLLATPVSGAEAGIPCIHRRNEGGTNVWGRQAALVRPGSAFPASRYATAMRGSLVLMSDPLGGSGTTPSTPGRVHRFLRSASGAWSHAGYFSSPSPAVSDFFGALLSHAGRDLLISDGEPGGRPEMGGSFPGATVTLNDDDSPTVSLETTAVDEPTTGTALHNLTVRLSQRSTSEVAVVWTTADGSATGGIDYTAANGTLLIPAGQDSGEIQISILSNPQVEPVETFSVSLTSLTGSRWDGHAAQVRIRDNSRGGVVHGFQRTLFEDLPPPPAEVRLLPQGTPLTIGWSTGKIGISGFPDPAASNFLAQAGVDWPEDSGELTASVATTSTFPLVITSDNSVEGTRYGSVPFQLPAGTVASSFSWRHFHLLPSDFTYRLRRPSSDGNTIAALQTGPENTLLLFQRSATAPGGWVQRVFPPPAGLVQWPDCLINVSHGRMSIYNPTTGEGWFFAENLGGPGNWGLEAYRNTLPLDPSFNSRAEFDGTTLVISGSTSLAYDHAVFTLNRATGQWDVPQTLTVPRNINFTDVRLHDGRLVVRIATGDPLTASYLFYERRDQTIPPWQPAGPPLTVQHPEDPQLGTGENFFVCGDVLVISYGVIFDATVIYRRQSDGSWQWEQTIPQRETVSISRGLIQTDFGIYADTGPAGGRWVCQEPQPSSGFLENGILLHYDGSSRFLISEAGFTTTLVDQDSYLHRATMESDWKELPSAVSHAIVKVQSAGGPALPIDVSIPFQTIPGGTATPGLDYQSVSGILNIPAGSGTGYFAVPIQPDALNEGAETVHLEFGTPTYGRGIPVLEASIADAPLLPAVPAAGSFVPEPATGSALYTIPFRLIRPSTAPLTVTYRILAGTATAADAVLTSGAAVTVPAGSSIIPIPLTILADSEAEGTEQLQISVTTRGLAVTADITIDDLPATGQVPDVWQTTQGQMLDFDPARNVLSNDTAGATTATAGRAPLFGAAAWGTDGTFRYTPSANFIGTDRFAYTASGGSLFKLSANTTWKWLHPTNGQDPGTTVPGFQSNWMLPAFNDVSWQNGMHLMGYGVLGSGGGGPGQPVNTTLPTPTNGNRYTAYFRTTFTISGAPAPGVGMEFSCDDAAIFYLNGTQIGRFDNTPGSPFLTAPDTYKLLASTGLDLEDETQVRRLFFPGAQFLPGDNTFAVSVHNNSASSSDLGLRIHQISAGPATAPVPVAIEVADGGNVPILKEDSYTVPGTTTPLDSHLIGGSTYQNDGLIADTGAPYDPILEAETTGSPAGPVTFDKDTGHFLMAAPAGFYGTTTFNYRVRDKDGWSLPATVTLIIQPSRGYDVWRMAAFGGGSTSGIGLPAQDADGDGLVNLLEFALSHDPAIADSGVTPLLLGYSAAGWEFSFKTRVGYGRDAFLILEMSSALAGEPWTPLARLNDWHWSLTRMSPGALLVVEEPVAGSRTYRVTLPFMPADKAFFRLRAIQERHILDP